MAQRPHIALIGPPAGLLADLTPLLAGLGYTLHAALRPALALDTLERQPVALAVLALPAGAEGWLDALRDLRDATDAALLVVAAGTDLVDRVAGLETGADDVVAAPVSAREVAARIAGILERRGARRRNLLRLERTAVDLDAARLLREGARPERLGPGEVMLLRALLGHPRRVLSRDDLMDLAPADSLDANDRSVDTRVARLRRKLDTDAIVTVRGHGYMFVPPFEA